MDYGGQDMISYDEDLPSDVLDMLASGFSDGPESKSDSDDDFHAGQKEDEHTLFVSGARDDTEYAADWKEEIAVIPGIYPPQRRAPNGLPQPIIQDVRKFYSQMFINTLNSGDIKQVTSFFQTYMARPCKIAIQHRISKNYGLPQFMNITGPQMFAHYLIGCFLTFPDMIIKLSNTRVVVSKEWRGCRIVMETEIYGSKLREISQFPWTPDGVDSLTALYGRLSITRNSNRMRLHTSPGGQQEPGSYRQPPERPSARSGSVSSISTSSSIGSGGGWGGGYYNSSAPAAAGGGRSHPGAGLTVSTAPPRTASGSNFSTSSSSTSATSAPVSPTGFMNAVVGGAHVLAHPLQLHTRGSITLYLDECNVMQYVLCDQAGV